MEERYLENNIIAYLCAAIKDLEGFPGFQRWN